MCVLGKGKKRDVSPLYFPPQSEDGGEEKLLIHTVPPDLQDVAAAMSGSSAKKSIECLRCVGAPRAADDTQDISLLRILPTPL